MRRPRGTASDRGYAVHLAKSDDGIRFTDIWSLRKEQLDGSPSLERCCLRRSGELWLLYVSYVDPSDNRWRIDVLTAGAPDAFDPGRREPVLTADSTGTEGVKDPFLLRVGPAWFMYVSYAVPVSLTAGQRAAAHATADIYNTGATIFPTGLATSLDGLRYAWQGQTLAVGGRGRWDGYQARLGCVLPSGRAWLGLYDGSAGSSGNYEERCGLALSLDLTRWLRLTPERPVLASPNSTGSLRYVDAADLGRGTYFYYEYARDDGAHDLRVAPAPGWTDGDA
jgi:hypothetical protein